MDFEVIVTLGPSLLNHEKKLKEVDALGPCLYRINGAHNKADTLGQVISQVRKILPKPRFMVDLPGNKVRTADLPDPIRLKKGEEFEIKGFQLNYPGFCSLVSKGDKIYANDSNFLFEVIDSSSDTIRFLSHSDGVLGSNKGMHKRGANEDLPFLFDADFKLIEAAQELKADFLSLSFVRTANDIKEVKAILNKSKDFKTGIIAKVETLPAVSNLGTIFETVDSILVDRGDLSTDVGIMKLPATQERVVEASRRANKKIYLATQFLKNMETKRVPLIPEVIDLHRTIKTGIAGLQLSEETAVGQYPVECVRLVFDSYRDSFSAV